MSSKWPRPIPSSWNKDSFNPLERRPGRGVDTGTAVERPVLATPMAGAACMAVCDEPCRDGSEILPDRILLNRLILIGHFSARLHGYGLRNRGCRGSRFRCGTCILRFIGACDFHLAVHLRALFNRDAAGQDVTANFSGAPDFHALASVQGALHFSPHYDFPRIHIGGNFAVRSDGNAAFGQADGTLYFPVDVQVFPALNLALDHER